MGRKNQRRRPGRSRPVLREEFAGLLLLFGAAFLMLALCSYEPRDGDLFIHLTGDEPQNLAGQVGATLAAVSFQLVGFGAFLAIAGLAWFGWIKLRGRSIPAKFAKFIGIPALLIFGSILAHFLIGSVEFRGAVVPVGGLLGTRGAASMVSAFGAGGGPLVAMTASLLAILAVTKLSLSGSIGRLLGGFVRGGQRVRTRWARWGESRRKHRARRNVIAKYASRRDNGSPEKPAEQGPVLRVKIPVVARRPGAPMPELPANLGTEVAATAPPTNGAPLRVPEPEPEPLPFEQPAGPDGAYALPETEILEPPGAEHVVDQKELIEKANSITSKAAEFNVQGEVVAIHPGPVVTTFEFQPGTGVKYSRITNLEEDLSLALRADTIRIARLAGRATVGIEVPNNSRKVIALRELVDSAEFKRSKSKLSLALGKQIHGENTIADLARMPHLLIAGTTGSGKSVALNCMLLSLLYKATPDDVKLVLIDPKRLEFGLYEDIPHLLSPVVVNPKLAANALSWAVREMERRYRLLADYGVRNIDQFNLILKRGGKDLDLSEDDSNEEIKPLPYIVVIIDELADLMMTSSTVVESAIIRLSQMARAVGIHLILATQRPSVDVITGVIKNNLPARISFRVASKVDSRVILDSQGAEVLLGKGDMLFLAPGTSRVSRVHGAYVGEKEVKRVVRFWRGQGRPAHKKEVTQPPPEQLETQRTDNNAHDEYYEDALRLVLAAGEASISSIQRKLRVGYARAGRIVDMMEQQGIVGPADGSKPRKILDPTFLQEYTLR